MNKTYEELDQEWNRLEVLRLKLDGQHDPKSGVYFEDEPWYPEFERIQSRQDEILVSLGMLHEERRRMAEEDFSQRVGR